MDATEYGRRVAGSLCMRCDADVPTAGQRSSRSQRRCPACGWRGGYAQRVLEWRVLAEYAAGRTATGALKALEGAASYPTVHGHYDRFRRAVFAAVAADKVDWAAKLVAAGPQRSGRRAGPSLFAEFEAGGEVRAVAGRQVDLLAGLPPGAGVVMVAVVSGRTFVLPADGAAKFRGDVQAVGLPYPDVVPPRWFTSGRAAGSAWGDGERYREDVRRCRGVTAANLPLYLADAEARRRLRWDAGRIVDVVYRGVIAPGLLAGRG